MNAFRLHAASLLTATMVVLAGCKSQPPVAVVTPVVTDLAVAQVQEQQIANSVSAVGTVHAKESAIISAQMIGRVTSVQVHEGDPVRAGQLLVTLDDAQARAGVEGSRAAVVAGDQQVRAAETEAALAKSTLQRYQLLRDRKSVSPQEFDEVEQRSQAAGARLEAARAQMIQAKATEAAAGTVANYARLSAPFSGYVTARHVDPGAMATPGVPLIEVERAGKLELNAAVDEGLLRTVQMGMPVAVKIEALGSQPLAGRVREIDPAGDPSSHSFVVRIELPENAKLRSGMFGTADIGNGSRSAVVVPRSALVTHDPLNGVWILNGDRVASLRYITLGAVHDDDVEVLSGLSAGEMVVLSAGDRELGGSRIEVRR
jgi:RND family efflux transporter MFP subunit